MRCLIMMIINKLGEVFVGIAGYSKNENNEDIHHNIITSYKEIQGGGISYT